MLTDEEKKEFLAKYVEETFKIPEDEKETYRQCMEEGVKKDWPEALRAMAYEKAFQCFSIGAASDLIESRYKLADMFLDGKGCIQSKIAGARLILSMYSECRKDFCAQHYNCKFADVALRVGGLFERGDGVDVDLEMAYTYYLEARCAIRRRRANYDFYGDAKVERKIEEALDRVKAQIPGEFFTFDDIYDHPAPIGALLDNSDGMYIT